MFTKWQLLKQFCAQHKQWISITLISSILSSVLTIAIPVSIGKYYELVFDFNAYRSKIFDWLPLDIGATIPQFLGFFAILVLLKGVFTFLERYCIGMLGEKLVLNVRNQLFEHQLYLPSVIYDEKGIGKYLLRFSGDLKSIQNYLSNGVIRFIGDLLLLIFACITLSIIHFQLGVLIATCLFLTTLIVIFFNRYLAQITRQRRRSKSILLSFVNTHLRSIHTIKSFNKEVPIIKQYKKRSDKVYHWGKQYQTITAFIRTLVPTAMYVMLGLVLLVIYQLKQQSVAIQGSTLLIFVMFLISLLPIFRRLLRVNIVWEMGNISFEKLLNVLNKANFENQDAIPLKLKEGSVQLYNLSFAYQGKNSLFEQLNWYFPAKNISLVTGASGSGKGSLIKLMMGLYQATSGTIYFDGQAIEQFSQKSIRKKITIVSAQLPLLGKTVFEAISYSRKAAKRPKAAAILEQLQANIPQQKRLQLDTPIGELGGLLSKGQQKLLFYARAFLTNKPILLIDEPFQDLDEEATLLISQALQQQQKKKTIILFSQQHDFVPLSINQYFDLYQHKQQFTGT